MQFTFLPVDERFFVRFTAETAALYPSGAFSTMSNYPVYAMRVVAADDGYRTEFFIPASDGAFLWVNMDHARLSRRT